MKNLARRDADYADNILEICVIDFNTFSESVEICEIRGLKS